MKHTDSTSKNQCLICGGTHFHVKLELKDYFLSKEDFKLIECKSCGFIFTEPKPAEEKIGRYYESEDYLSHNTQKKDLVSRLYVIARNIALRNKYNLVKTVSSGKKLLDIGCGTGEFLAFMKAMSYEAMGIEPSKNARAFAKSTHQIDVAPEAKLNELPDKNFDLITMWHVLEHVYHLNDRMDTLWRLLKNDGALIVALPNHRSADAKHYGKYWAAWDVPRHLYHFHRDSLTALLEKHNFKLELVKPMSMDSFYVSLLSEELKSGKKKMLPAFYHGMVSNLHAIKTNEYSSLIYIASKKQYPKTPST